MEDLKYQIVTLGNGNKYFVYDEYNDDSGRYNLILNVENESDIEIVKQESVDSKLILKEVVDIKKKIELSNIFKSNDEKESA